VQTLPVLFRPSPSLLPADLDGNGVAFLEEHLRRLRELPAHGNRVLHLHQLFVALLLSFFDPTVRSLRQMEDQGNFDGRLDLQRLARSTTSDALAVFDPEHLTPIIQDLRRKVACFGRSDRTLAGITKELIAADGTYLNICSDVAWALHQRRRNGKPHAQVRLNVQMDVATWTPQVISVSGDDGSEPDAFARDLLEGVLYVIDRNFLDFDFLDQLLGRDNDFVLRVRANAPAVLVTAERPLTAADVEAGVVSDQTVTLTGPGAPQGPMRLVTIQTFNRSGKPETIKLLTNLVTDEVPAHVVGEIYHRRWQIELFFKWLKTWARLDHLLSTSRNGITFQFYTVVIGVLLMYMQLGRRVSLYALTQLRMLIQGRTTLQQALAVIAKRERERELNRASAAARREKKKLA
jgi:hypothetical protein